MSCHFALTLCYDPFLHGVLGLLFNCSEFTGLLTLANFSRYGYIFTRAKTDSPHPHGPPLNTRSQVVLVVASGSRREISNNPVASVSRKTIVVACKSAV